MVGQSHAECDKPSTVLLLLLPRYLFDVSVHRELSRLRKISTQTIGCNLRSHPVTADALNEHDKTRLAFNSLQCVQRYVAHPADPKPHALMCAPAPTASPSARD